MAAYITVLNCVCVLPCVADIVTLQRCVCNCNKETLLLLLLDYLPGFATGSERP